MEIVTTLLTTSVQEFETQFTRTVPFCTTFQIDIQDGLFVPSSTLSAEHVCATLNRLKVSRGELVEGCTFDFHLQVTDYLPSLSAIHAVASDIRIRYIFAHTNFALTTDLERGTWHSELSAICPALNPEDRLTKDTLFVGRPLLSFPAIQIMTIHPGPQGQVFIPKQLERINELRNNGYKGKIVVDGSINPISLTHILSLPSTYHPDIVCIGSYLSRAPNQEVGGRIETLKTLVA